MLVAATGTPLLGQASDELVQSLIEFLGDADKEIRAIALEQIRSDVKGAEATKRFAAELTKIDQQAQADLIRALGDRRDATAKPAITAVLDASGDEAIRIAAVIALGKLGDSSDCQRLVDLLSEQGKLAAAARDSLTSLQGEGVSQEIVDQISLVASPQKSLLIDILSARRAKEQIPALLGLATGNDAAVRGAAMRSLGQLADPEHVPAMISGLLIAAIGNERDDAERNLMRVCNRIEDPDKRAEPLVEAMQQRSAGERTLLLPALGRIGGKPALVEIEKAIQSPDEAIHQAGIRGLSNWPDASVAPQLFDLAKTDKHPDHRRIARMTLLRIAPLPDGRTDAERLELLIAGMKIAQTDDEKNYALKRAAPIRLVQTLRFVLPYVDQTRYAREACQSIVELAHDRQLRDDNKAEFHAALDKVIATTKDAVLIDRANRYKKGQTWVRPK